MQIQISWLLQKPLDLGFTLFAKAWYIQAQRTRVNTIFQIYLKRTFFWKYRTKKKNDNEWYRLSPLSKLQLELSAVKRPVKRPSKGPDKIPRSGSTLFIKVLLVGCQDLN